MSFRIIHGDALEELARLPAESVDSMVTDPPAGISFMGKEWDSFPLRRNRPSDSSFKDGRKRPCIESGPQWQSTPKARAGFIAAMTGIFTESLRVLKPGAHALVWSIPRTSHWTATALEDAGFEIRDVVVHLFGTGFPKSLDVSKAIDKAAGAEREVIGRRTDRAATPLLDIRGGNYNSTDKRPGIDLSAITAPATEAARQWEGWGTALKPAAEHWILCRKPLIGTVAANVLEHGTGGINVDGCRVGSPAPSTTQGQSKHAGEIYGADQRDMKPFDGNPWSGRWPANVVLSHADGCVLKVYGKRTNEGQAVHDYADADGLETVPAYDCVPECPVRLLDEQSGELTSGVPMGVKAGVQKNTYGVFAGGIPVTGYGDTGTASRFFYCSKPSTAERNVGFTDNRHPTVKSAELMAYFCRLITPPGGTVLDPFMGSGSTGIAALREGFEFIGIEREAEYVELARRRIQGDAPLLNREVS